MQMWATGLSRTTERQIDRRRRRGFTLVEILAVIVIITILSGMMVPVLISGLDRARTDASLGRVTQTIAFTANLAATDGKPYRLNIDRQLSRFWISFESNPLEEPGVYTPLKLSDISAWSLDESMRVQKMSINGTFLEEEIVDEEVPYIEFRPDGTADGMMLFLETESEDVYTIVLSPITGRVRIFDYEVGDEGFAPPEQP